MTTERISTLEVRRRLGDLLNRVALRQDQFVIERKGKPLAALVPADRFESLELVARRYGLALLERQKGSGLSDEDAQKLALEAVRWARQRARRKRRRR